MNCQWRGPRVQGVVMEAGLEVAGGQWHLHATRSNVMIAGMAVR
jgi:hypothetical protein